MKNLALNLRSNIECEFNSPETSAEEKIHLFHVPRNQASMQRAGEFVAGSCTVSEIPIKRKQEQEERAETQASFHRVSNTVKVKKTT